MSILLGNGFSIAYDRDIFSYRRLLDASEFEGLDKEELFEAVGTEDFERAIAALRKAARLAQIYGDDHADFIARMDQDADVIRRGLCETISRLHPENSQLVSDDEVVHSSRFLAPFHQIFTLNYDLLLYWVIVRGPALNARVPAGYDGFRPTVLGGHILAWTGEHQYAHFLHGALHLFMDGGPDGLPRLLKIHGRDGLLMDQVRNRIERDSYPLVVTEGSAEDKLEKISESPYLSSCLWRLIGQTGNLFLYGVGLNENDLHIARAIAHSGVTNLYVGVYGTGGHAGFRARISEMAERREELGKPELRITYYDAASASPWRP